MHLLDYARAECLLVCNMQSLLMSETGIEADIPFEEFLDATLPVSIAHSTDSTTWLEVEHFKR